ncbi:hypothetical protein KEM54_002702 [Ascosphaera aggregata]|nr:hypothetical protein KEM54_002702 [Ascosphaera aggregata]
MQSITKNPPSNSASQNWPCPSHIEVVLRNLRLLHLDQRPDWPKITVKSFHPSQQNLRTRVKCVEWTLYQLLLIWDPEETQNKLDPFFPPADQLQSINLRAAIFKIISELKKCCALGRDFILRKSMFDDCKGEKFEELLAIFSTAVLHVWLDKNRDHIADTPMLAVARGRSVSNPEYTLPMVISLRHSLERLAKGGQSLKSNEAYWRAAKILEQQEQQIDASLHDSAGSLRPSLKRDDPLYRQTHEKILNSWQGDQTWVHTILEGGFSKVFSDRLLGLDFPESWQLLMQGSDLNDLSNQSGIQPDSDPLSSLEKRLAEQRSRLKLWKDFRDAMSNEKSRNVPFRHHNQASHHIFQRHQELTVSGISKDLDPYDTSHLMPERSEHAKVIEALDTALLALKRDGTRERGHRACFGFFHMSRNTPDEQSEIGFLQSSKSSEHLSLLETPASPTTSPSTEDASVRQNDVSATSTEALRDVHSLSLEFKSIPRRTARIGAARETGNSQFEETPSDPSPAFTGTNANTIHLTHTERTKPSMSSFSQQELPPTSFEPHEGIKSPRAHHALLTPSAYSTPHALDPQSPTFNLSNVTGKLISGRSTPREELFDQEADYARVFKSRPKVALSPVRPPLPIFRDNRRIEDMPEEDYEDPSMLDDAILLESPLMRRFR